MKETIRNARRERQALKEANKTFKQPMELTPYRKGVLDTINVIIYSFIAVMLVGLVVKACSS